MTETTLTGFRRIVTNPRIFPVPATLVEGLAFVDALRHAPRGRWLAASAAAWRRFADLSRADDRVRGSLAPDAWLAALARAHGCRIATSYRGFARFEGLDWFDPAKV